MMNRIWSIGLLFLCASYGSSEELKIALNGDNTKVKFTGSKPDGKHDGGFKTVTGTATVDAGKPETLQFQVDFDINSLYSDNPMLTNHLKSPDFFDVKNHPKAKFQSTKVEKSTAGVQITGKLTLLGKTKEITFPAKVSITDGGLTLASSLEINRTDFGMTYGKGKVNDEVAIQINLNTNK